MIQLESIGQSSNSLITPRLTIILHPNTSRIDIVLNDRKFNNERYYHSRKNEAVGYEKVLLDYCNLYVNGIKNASTGKNVMHLEICDGMLLKEIIPEIIVAIKHWGSSVEPYNPEIYLENRRYEVAPEYHEDGYPIHPGVREHATKPDIGVPYKVWVDGQ